MSIKDKRIEAEMSQEELAVASGVSRVAITRYESGERVPNINIAARIARALNCKVDDLLNDS